MFSLLNFDNVTFEGKLAGIPVMFTNFTDPDYVPSKFYEDRFKRGMAARTQDVIYEVLRMYKGTLPNMEAYVAETKKGYIAEIKTGNTVSCAMLLRKRDGSFYIKAGIIDENDVISSFKLDGSTKNLIMLALMPEILK